MIILVGIWHTALSKAVPDPDCFTGRKSDVYCSGALELTPQSGKVIRLVLVNLYTNFIF